MFAGRKGGDGRAARLAPQQTKGRAAGAVAVAAHRRRALVFVSWAFGREPAGGRPWARIWRAGALCALRCCSSANRDRAAA